jgi:hypothetical protein
MQTQTYRSTRLTDQERENPTSVFDDFFDYYHIQSVQLEIQELVRVGLTTDNESYDTGAKRDNLLYLQKNLLRLMEAANLITTPSI